jgi:hypothetical protein
MKSRLFLPAVIIFVVVVCAGIAHAGSLTPSAVPAANGYTLSDIFNRLLTNTATTSGSHAFAATTTPQSTFPTLIQIYGAIPTIYPSDFLASSTYLGVTGSVAVKTGDNTASSTSISTNKFLLAPAPGYYDGTATVSTTSTAFDATNIRNNTYLLGMTGTYSGYPGTGWTANAGTVDVDPGTTLLSQANCESVGGVSTGWYWFQDANGDGDATDSEDGVCVKGAASTAVSWNGATLITAAAPAIASSTATGGEVNTIASTTAAWTVNAFKNYTAKVTMGSAVGCWGMVKSNTAATTTVYGSWLTSAYAPCAANPDSTSGFKLYDDGDYDNSWIGDYTCTGNYPNGTVVPHSYPSTDNSALAQADCYDGKRDLLPAETNRAVISGTITTITTNTVAGTSTITDTALATSMVDVNVYIGQKVLITSGTGVDSYALIESNTANSFTVGTTTTGISPWSGSDPIAGSGYKVVYIISRSSTMGTDDIKQYNGPLNTETLKAWTGTRLPTSMDWVGFCGYKDGTTAGANAYESVTNALSASKTFGSYGGQVGRTDELMDLANSAGSWEWLSEPNYYNNARVAGGNACSYFYTYGVYLSYRFRAVFRP